MGKRNSQLTELTVVATNDYLTIVDTSAGQSKRVSVQTLVGNVDLGWVATGESWTYSSWSSTTQTGVVTVPSNATTKYTAGMRVRFSQTTGGTKYAIITAVTTTTLTLFFPSGTTFNNETVTSPVYSSIKAPYGFNLDAAVWELAYTSSTDDSASAAPASGTWYQVPSAQLVVPVGSWFLGYHGSAAGVGNASAALRFKATLATANNTESDSGLSTYLGLTNTNTTPVIIGLMAREKSILLGSQTTYYLNMARSTGGGAMSVLSMQGSQAPTRIYARCAYL